MDKPTTFGRRRALSVVAMAGASAFAASAQVLKNDELAALMGTCETAADYNKLAEHYLAKAESLDKDAARQEELAKRYRRTHTRATKVQTLRYGLVSQAQDLGQSLRIAAAEARQLADVTGAIATEAAD